MSNMMLYFHCQERKSIILHVQAIFSRQRPNFFTPWSNKPSTFFNHKLSTQPNMKSIRPLLLTCSSFLLFACGGNPSSPVHTEMPPPAYTPAATMQSFPGVRANYTIRNTASGFAVSETATSKITMIDSGITSLQFADVSVNLQIAKKVSTISATNVQKIEELYVAFFNRVPDANGLAYWIDQVAAGASINQVAETFYMAALNFPVETGYNTAMSNGDFIKIVYKNVLGRTSVDQGGMDYWSNSLVSGKETRASLVASILYSAHTFKGNKDYGYVADLLDNKLSIADYFAIKQGLGYLTDSDSITNGMKIAAAVSQYETVNAKKLIAVGTDDSADIFTAPVIAKPDVAQILSHAQACPEGSSNDPGASSCFVGTAAGTTSFGNTACNLSISDDGTISMVVGINSYQFKKPYSVSYLKSTAIASSPDAYFSWILVSGFLQSFSLDLKSPGIKRFSQTPSLTAEVKFLTDFSKNVRCNFPLPN